MSALFCRKLSGWACLGPIILALLSISTVWAFQLHEKSGVNIIGEIERGLPPFTIPWWGRMGHPWQILRTAGIAAIVSALEAISIGKALGEFHGYTIDPNVELKGGSRAP